MLDFPFYSNTIWLGLFAFIGGALGILQTIYDWKKADKNKPDEKENFQLTLNTIISPIFLFVGVLSIYSTITSVYSFRNLPVKQISAINVTPMKDESTALHWTKKIYENQKEIQSGIILLRKCFKTTRNHENYSDGYKIELIFEDSNLNNKYEFTVYRKSSNNTPEKKIVILPGGEYGCPSFQEWIKNNIDPLFEKIKSSPQ